MALLAPLRSPALLSHSDQRHQVKGICNASLRTVTPAIGHLSTQKCFTSTSPRQQRSGRAPTSASAAAATTVAVPAAQAAFPALQAAVAPLLPYAMAAAALCCFALIALVRVPGLSHSSCEPNTVSYHRPTGSRVLMHAVQTRGLATLQANACINPVTRTMQDSLQPGLNRRSPIHTASLHTSTSSSKRQNVGSGAVAEVALATKQSLAYRY